jgi:hypothetical protein
MAGKKFLNTTTISQKYKTMIEKKLSDYLHFYLGCDCFTDSGMKGSLIQVNSKSLLCRLVINKAGQDISKPIKEVKPTLRRISSMTEEEKKDLFAFIFRRPFPDSGRILFFDKATTQSDPRYVLMTGVERLGIEMNGTVWADSDLHNYKHNQHAVTAWLLKKGFWLFGDDWFTAGIIIDKDTFF